MQPVQAFHTASLLVPWWCPFFAPCLFRAFLSFVCGLVLPLAPFARCLSAHSTTNTSTLHYSLRCNCSFWGRASLGVRNRSCEAVPWNPPQQWRPPQPVQAFPLQLTLLVTSPCQCWCRGVVRFFSLSLHALCLHVPRLVLLARQLLHCHSSALLVGQGRRASVQSSYPASMAVLLFQHAAAPFFGRLPLLGCFDVLRNEVSWASCR
jgi:hypothetical protein